MAPEQWIGVIVGAVIFIFAPRINMYWIRGPVIRRLRPAYEEFGAMFLRTVGGVFIGSGIIGPPVGGLLGAVVGIVVSRLSEERDRLILEKDREGDVDDSRRLPT